MLRAASSTSQAARACVRRYSRKTPYEDPHYKGPIPTNSVWERSKKAVQRVNKLFTVRLLLSGSFFSLFFVDSKRTAVLKEVS